ncbi:MAG: hypothetical protein KKF44_05085, partial [Nanoarchaeota archaeon]|nr:hypothetical protein [Nanoarchaeota archaeon]
MRKNMILFLILLFVFVATFAAAAVISSNLRDTKLARVKAYQDCERIDYEVKQDVWGKCNREINQTVCNEDNSSCDIRQETERYDCVVDQEILVKTKERCDEPTGYLIDDAVRLATKDYVCDSHVEDGSTVVICDSIYDGNGDGVCSSGET